MFKRVFLILVVVGVFYGLVNLFRGKPEEKSSPLAPSQASVAPSVQEETENLGLPKPREASPAARSAPGDNRKLFEEIDAHLQAGDVDAAVKVLQDLLEKDPRNERAMEELGMIYMTEYQDPSKAAAYFRQVLEVNPNNEFAVMELVGVSSHPERAGDALNFMKEMEKSHPSPVLSDGIGELLMSQGRLSEAIPYLEKSASDPKYAEFAYSRMASVYQQMGDLEKASESYGKAIEQQRKEIEKRKAEGHATGTIESDMARGLLDQARVMIKRRKVDRAEDLIEQAGSILGRGDWEYQTARDELERARDAG